ncbi:MAG: aspartate aminotransferase family protein [Candidatus Nanopelagicales bacterium]
MADSSATGETPNSATGTPVAPLTGGVEPLYARVGAALDRFLTEDRPDPATRRAEWVAALERPLPDEGIGADATLDELLEVVVPNGSRVSDPGFWGWIVTGPATVPAAAAAAALIAAPHRYSIIASNLVEDLSLRWLADLCGLGPHMRGIYSSGGSTANLVALGAARQWAFEQRGIDVAKEGVGGVRTAIYASAEVHHTIQRSAGVLGMGRSQVRMVPVDHGLRMRPDALAELIGRDVADGVLPVAVVGTAGTTNTGAIDPLRAVGEIAHAHGAWFHVDGAYGLPGSLDERVRPLYDGLELADSAIVDPHKWLGVPVGTGATFVRDRELLRRAFTQEPADYLAPQENSGADAVTSLDSMGVPYADLGVELTAPARGIPVWSVMRELGREGVAARIRQDNDFARRVADEVRAHPRLELLTEPTLSILCFRYLPPADAGLDDAAVDAINAELVHRLHIATPYVPSTTKVHGRLAIRPCFVNSRTTDSALDGFTDTVVAFGESLAATSA